MNQRIPFVRALTVAALLQAAFSLPAAAEVVAGNITNTRDGTDALLNIAPGATDNSAFGNAALTVSIAKGNSAFGSHALDHNTTGQFNNAFGAGAISSNTGGESNNAFGSEALAGVAMTGSANSAFGDQAMFNNTRGSDNAAVGVQTLFKNTVGSFNAAFGNDALSSNTTGSSNVAFGHQALKANTTAIRNVALGVISLNKNTTGSNNTALGYSALNANTIGRNNTGLGVGAGARITTGRDNIAIGLGAGSKITTGGLNIQIGNIGVAGDTLTMRLGRQGIQRKTFIAGIRGTTVSGAAVVVNSAGQLGVVSSSRRYKQDIADMGEASNPLLKLRPVTFRYKEADEHGQHPLQYGLIAEEVAEVMPELVVRDEDGRPETVAYHTLSSLLLNEYQQQHRDMQTLASAARDAQQATAQRLVGLEQKLASRDQELVALRDEMAKLTRMTQQLQAALPSAQGLATSQP